MEWKTVKLGEVITIKYGKDHKALKDGNIPVFGSGGIMRYADKSIYDGPSILIPRKGSLNNIMYSETPFWTVDTMFWTIIDTSIADPKFLYYSLVKRDFAGLNVGSAVPSLTVPVIEAIEISLPSLTDQKRIAAILSSLDDKIENNNRINRNLEAQAQALFKSWFVDFEPFGGKMPEDWREGVIADLVNLLNGFAFKSSDFVENGQYKLITIKGVQDGKMTIDGADCLDMFPNKMPQWCQLQKGDILLSLTGNVGRCCLVDMDYCLLNQRVAKLQPKAEYNRLFVYSLFRQEEMKARMVGISRGTAQMNLSPVETGKLSIVIPSEEVLQKFGERYNGIIAALLNSIEESQRLAALRDTLLPKLMKGEIEV